jgi:hypothetical protein
LATQISGPVKGGVGEIDAYLYGSDVFTAPVNTCGSGQMIDILGATTADFDALPCPVQGGDTVHMGFVLPIPAEAAGLGQLNITLMANDTSTRASMVYCLDLVATL